MKLFTEKELRDFIDINGCIVESDLDEKQLTPIELPSDKEIYERAFQQWGDYSKTSHQNAYSEGAKWMRDKIQGGNK